MSADARVWQKGDGRQWVGVHDGPCDFSARHAEPKPLHDLLSDIEDCLDAGLRWEAEYQERHDPPRIVLSGWLA